MVNEKNDMSAQRPIPKTWNAVAENYTLELSEADYQLAKDIQQVFEKNGILPGARILELGCGSGHISACLAQVGYKVALLDFADKALEKASNTFTRLELKADFYKGDLFSLHEQTDKAFDLVWNSGVMEHFTDSDFVQILTSIHDAYPDIPFLFLVPNGQSRAYLAYRFALCSKGMWDVGKEYINRDYETLCNSSGYEISEIFYTAKKDTQDKFSYLSNGTLGDDVYRTMMQEDLFPANEQYLVAFFLKPIDSSQTNSEKALLTIAQVPDYAYEKRLEDCAQKFNISEKEAYYSDLIQSFNNCNKMLAQANQNYSLLSEQYSELKRKYKTLLVIISLAFLSILWIVFSNNLLL